MGTRLHAILRSKYEERPQPAHIGNVSFHVSLALGIFQVSWRVSLTCKATYKSFALGSTLRRRRTSNASARTATQISHKMTHLQRYSILSVVCALCYIWAAFGSSVLTSRRVKGAWMEEDRLVMELCVPAISPHDSEIDHIRLMEGHM